jgi:uncharacterized protein YceK
MSIVQGSGGEGVAVMGGVRLGVSVLGDRRFVVFPEKTFVVLDMPFSCMLDVLFLPAAVVNEHVFHDGIDVSADQVADPRPPEADPAAE